VTFVRHSPRVPSLSPGPAAAAAAAVYSVHLLHWPKSGWRGGATVARRTLDREVTGSIPGRGVAA